MSKRSREEKKASDDSEQIEIQKFLDELSGYNPAIPDETIQYLLEKSGCNCNDEKLKRLVALASQKFLIQVLTDAKAYKTQGQLVKDKKDQQLSLEELSKSLRDQGISVEKPEFFADSGLGFS